MSDTAQYRLKAAKVDASVYSSVVAESVAVNRNAQKLIARAGGRINADVVRTMTVAPIIEFEVREVDKITAPTEAAAFALAFQAHDSDAGLGTGIISLTAKALLVPVSIRADKGQPAALRLRAVILSSDGSTVPFTVGTTDQTLATTDDIYTVGDSTLGGSSLGGVTSQEVLYNYRLQTNEGESGFVYPTHAFILDHNPVIRLSTVDLAAMTSARINAGDVVDSNCVSAVFATRSGGSAKSFTLAKGMVDADVQGGVPSVLNIEVQGRDNDTDDSTFIVAA